MACFLVPASEAVITTIVAKVVKSHESKDNSNGKIKLSKKLNWLNGFLWGGSGLLAFEHLWHGEISPYFPFITTASNSSDFTGILHEIMTSGIAMSAIVTIFWLILCTTVSFVNKHTTNNHLLVNGESL